MDIRLQQVVFSKVVESKLLPADKKNELGIFVTLSEKPVTGTANNQTKPNRRLIYTSYPRKKYAPLNQINNLVYQGQYKGGDLRLIIEVVEFDSNENELVRSMPGTLIEAGKTTSSYSNPLYSELLNSLGQSIITSVTKDDLIASFDMELRPCDSIKNNPQQIYLSTGDLVFVRQNQNEEKPQLDWQEISLNPDKTLILDDEMSYMTMSIIKRK